MDSCEGRAGDFVASRPCAITHLTFSDDRRFPEVVPVFPAKRGRRYPEEVVISASHPLRPALFSLGLLISPAVVAQTSALPDAPSATAHTAPAATPTGPTVLFQTSMGRLTCQLFDQEAPQTTANFVGLATGTKAYTDPATHQPVTGRPYYNGTQFHRVIPGFMIQ